MVHLGATPDCQPFSGGEKEKKEKRKKRGDERLNRIEENESCTQCAEEGASLVKNSVPETAVRPLLLQEAVVRMTAREG